ncbi:MAG: transcription elongation factor GreB [Gammaproteobacteria bacterium]|nr:transcription elongation factor GreB [Gammaproteobacteria bacterium]
MGRYRPPQPAASKYITPEGKQRLAEEVDKLWKKRRPEVTKALAAAAAEGDRSENAEYIYRKKELREIDARLRHLRKRLDGIKVVDRVPEDKQRVYFGAWVRLEDDAGEERLYRVVGPDEIDPALGYISIDSPMGKALIGKSLDQELTLRLSQGETTYLITEISYTRID